MLPFIVGGFGLLGIGCLAKKVWDYFMDKKVLFLLHGEEQAGKSTLISTLTGKTYEAYTAEHEEIDISGVSNEENSDFSAIAMIDVGGRRKTENEEVRNDFFKRDALKAFLYVFDAEKLYDPKSERGKRSQYGLQIYKQVCKEKNVLFYAIGTRADKFTTRNEKEEIEERIRRDFGVRVRIINACNKEDVAKTYIAILEVIQEKYQ